MVGSIVNYVLIEMRWCIVDKITSNIDLKPP